MIPDHPSCKCAMPRTLYLAHSNDIVDQNMMRVIQALALSMWNEQAKGSGERVLANGHVMKVAKKI